LKEQSYENLIIILTIHKKFLMQQPYYEEAYSIKYDLSNCEEEPLHIIRYLQPHAVLIACGLEDLKITNVTENVYEMIGWEVDQLLGITLDHLIPSEVLDIVHRGIKQENFRKINPLSLNFKNQKFNAILHLSENLLFLELELSIAKASSTQFLHLIDDAIQQVQRTDDIDTLLNVAAREIRTLTSFDRVMIYQFDENYDGDVVAEERSSNIESYLGLHYPASDIPKQARELFLKNQIRVISDVGGTPVKIIPSTHPISKNPLDLTYSIARGVSPVHLEYLGNMGVKATMSIAIKMDDQLWGLIACHHYSPKLIDYGIREIIRFLGQIISGHLSLQASQLFRQSTLNSNLIRAQLVEQMSRDWNIEEGLTKNKIKLTDINSSMGAAICMEGKIYSIGKTVKEDELLALIQWLNEQIFDSFFQTNKLSEHYPTAEKFREIISGLLAVRISQGMNDYVMWFKPEVAQTVSWGGKPDKILEETENGLRMTPRKSFQKWEEKVAGRAESWKDYEIQNALVLRNDIKDFIFEKYREVRQLNEDLVDAYKELEQFSYSISHDLRAPLRSIDGFAEILSEDYAEQLDDYGKSLLQIIKDNIKKMNLFIDDLLRLAKLGKNDLQLVQLDLVPIIKDIELTLRAGKIEDRNIALIIVEPLPQISGDRTYIYQLFQNLLSNAFKYTQHEAKAKIEIGGRVTNEETIYYIQDNGIGFDQKYADKAFEIFSRLVREDEFEGTGIGLAIVKKIMQQHKGNVHVESELGKGSTFFLHFPNS